MSPQLLPDSSSPSSPSPICTPYTIPQGSSIAPYSSFTRQAGLISVTGLLIINETFEIDLIENAVFRPYCDGNDSESGVVHSGFSDNSTVTDQRPPFYASTSPQMFAIAVATMISYVLLVLIFITPRTFFVGGPGGGAGFLTRRGLGGKSSVIGIGRRPLLQKIAAVMVALSLTVATALTFEVAKSQYANGFMNSEAMVREVVSTLRIRVAHLVSDTFLWLAQVQTLIRLFPRHKEKVTIKWLGFALILLDTIFSSLNSFLPSDTDARPIRSREAIPALSYLFELAIGFIYASCVVYYSISKYRFAFYHAKMRNICLVALLSIASVLIPVVFFVIDVSSPGIATWGFYIRWVGAIAASVVVWEWVERIEALERDETKDGVLGREIYDGDDMLDVSGVSGFGEKPRRPGHGSTGGGNLPGPGWTSEDRRRRMRPRNPFRKRKKANPSTRAAFPSSAQPTEPTTSSTTGQTPPTAAVAPSCSRLDTTSAASTVYTVRYHNVPGSSPEIAVHGPHPTNPNKGIVTSTHTPSTTGPPGNVTALSSPHSQTPTRLPNGSSSRQLWAAVTNPFKRKRSSPPAEVAGAQLLEENTRRSPAPVKADKWKLGSRRDGFSTVQRKRLRVPRYSSRADDPLPVTVIPARPRGTRTWSPPSATLAVDADDRAPSGREAESRQGGADRSGAALPRPATGRHTRSAEDMPAEHDGGKPNDSEYPPPPGPKAVPLDQDLTTTNDLPPQAAPQPTYAAGPSSFADHLPEGQNVVSSPSAPDAGNEVERKGNGDRTPG